MTAKRLFLLPPPDRIYAILCVLAVAAPAFAAADNTTFQPQDYILLNCGASGQANDTDGRTWAGDTGSKFVPPQNTISSQAPQSSDAPGPIPYTTARVSASPFTYSFSPLAAGRKFIRLYFYPYDYSGHAASDAFFSVTAGNHTFLSNFSAFQTAQALNLVVLTKEYSVNVSTGGLNLTFTPSARANAYAFINGIEVVSIPDIFIAGSPNLVIGGGQQMIFNIDPSWAVETLYRLNVGGQTLSPLQDSGLYRSWSDDSSYIYAAEFGVSYPKDPNVTIAYPSTVPKYVAPELVYATARSMGPDAHINMNYNLTWMLTVDAGFYYLVRLHFCEIQYPITKVNQREFDVYLNNQTAQQATDVIILSGGIGVPVFEDYVVITAGRGQMDLWVALHPNNSSRPEYYDAILNGLEVFKLQNSNASLAGLNPEPRPQPAVDPNKGHNKQDVRSKSNKVPTIVGGVVGGSVVLIAAVCCIIAMYRRQKKKKKGRIASASDGTSAWLPFSHSVGSAKTNATRSRASSFPPDLCRQFSFADIKAATKDFDESLLLGVGGFGKVYCGEIDGGTKVAIKRGNPMAEQGVHEFQTEIEMLSKLRHKHLVSLIGFCEESCEMILVYDYMAHGTLREHLYKTRKPSLTWRQRLEICIGAARGLHYLHTGTKHAIIHRDVKTTNILLDDKLVAKVADFGLSKTGPTALDQTHVSTVVKGSFGYLDPEYFKRQKLTEKSDVYSFGVVLFEVLCGRPALSPTLPADQASLAEWAVRCHKKGVLDQIVDPYLKGKIAPRCFSTFAETAVKCLSDVGTERPAMSDVLWSLEFALQLQDQESTAEDGGSTSMIGISKEETHLMMFQNKGHGYPSTDQSDTSYTASTTMTTTSASAGEHSRTSVDSDGLTPSAVFSQIMDPKGR